MKKNRRLKFVVITGALSGVAIFVISILTFLVSSAVVYFFKDGAFIFSFEYVKKALSMGGIAAIIAAIGIWLIEYKNHR